MSPTQSSGLWRNRQVIAALIPLAVYWVCTLAGLVRFHLWQQVVNMWQLEYGLLDKLEFAHGLRYTLVLPIFLLADWLGISHDRLFSAIVPLLLLVITWFTTLSLMRFGGGLTPGRQALAVLGISLFLIALSLFMNGRLMFAFAGSSLLMWALLAWQDNRDAVNFAAVVGAIFLSCVTSGTFLIVSISFYFFLAVNVLLRNPAVCRRGVLLTYALLLVVLNPVLSMFVFKNLEFYGGGTGAVFEMLSHGYGGLLVGFHPLLLAAVLLAAGFAAYLLRALIRRYWIISSLVVIYLCGGLFGYSTALVVLPALLVLAGLVSFRLLDRVLPARTRLLT